jgi:hypothetical protein
MSHVKECGSCSHIFLEDAMTMEEAFPGDWFFSQGIEITLRGES